MKRTILLTLLSAITIGMMANPVGREEAKEKAAQFLCTSRTAKIKNLQQMERRLQPVEAGFSHLHVFNNGQDGGFIVVSADDRTEEVLAYSEGGTFGDVPVNGGLYEILIGLNSQVADAASDHTFTSRNDTEPKEQDRDPIYPMITTSWNQYDPYYDFCPTDPSSGRPTLVGCVAVTLAQIMKYYEYPKKTLAVIPAYTTSNGINMPQLPVTTFDYDKMLDYYDPFDDYYNQEQLDAVQKILKYAGCAVQMQYSSGGSAATFNIAKISQYFGYRSDAKLLHAAMYPRDTWEDMIYNELAAGRPVPYSAGAVMQQNHQFIIDGYDGRGYFHANTGEYGFFSGLFYCKLHVINDCETQTGGVEFSGYNCYQAAVFNFQPKDSSQPLQDLPAEQNMDGKVSKIVMNGVHFYNPYVEQRTVAIANISNQGETYENMLFLWQGETLKGGVGTYVPPGESGEVVICIASPMETGNYPVRFTTDWEGKDVVFETTLKITEQPEFELSAYITQEGLKGYIWNNAGENGYEEPIWSFDPDWEEEAGIYEQLKVEADITNTSKNRYNSWIYSSLEEKAQEGELYSWQGKPLVDHFYYVDLAPGETKHFTFLFDKHLFKTDKLYHYRLEYNNEENGILFSFPNQSPYFSNLPGGLKGDANLDGKINISDVSAIINYILAKDPHPFNSQNADKDNNGLVNISDVTAIINLILAK